MSLVFKGTSFTLSVLALTEADLPSLPRKLADKVEQAPGFFQGAPLVVDLSKLETQPDFTALAGAINEQGLICVGVCGARAAWKDAAKAAGLAVLKPARAGREQAPTLPAQVHQGQVRSGQQLYAKGRDLVVLGSVGAGAEVISDGSIHIYGSLRGRAIAGASGSVEARILCQKLEAELVSIAGTYWLSDDLQGEQWQQSAQILLDEQQLALKPLN
ncbi:septum site-determining protein MinC [Gallaecimonas sp. GXIMD4217]|uniref:septum site-determining protein MinC n=1 Tax=Gallaecimonas sp. GXIMD4217 TaxID=3131927 RepID=UPI00311B08F7